MNKAFVLLSGGLDSTTCLYVAAKEYEQVEAVSINYGQRHAKELRYAQRSAEGMKERKGKSVRHVVLHIPDLLGGTMLTDRRAELPNASYADLPEGVSPTYVPFRNGLMLSMLSAWAQRWVNEQPDRHAKGNVGIYFGAHAEDAQNWAYPDCTPEFIGAMANAIHVGTYFKIRLHTPLMWLRKSEIVRLGHRLGVDFADTWSCYAGGEKHCGKCPTCRARREAFELAGVADPTEYEAETER